MEAEGTQAFSSDDVASAPSTQFEDTLADYQPPKRHTKKDESKDVKGPSVFITPSTEPPKEKVSKPLKFLGAGSDNMCKKCNKRVYEMEKIIADKAIFHKSCFRCAHCKRVLTLGNFAGIDEQTYCKPHFIELFKKKGKYDMAKQTQEKPRDTQPQPTVREVQAAQVESTQSAAPTRVNGSADDDEAEEETKKTEPVRYQQMNSVRNMFETASRTPTTQSAPPQKKSSKWDKPRDPSPAPPRQDPEPEASTEEEMPPTTITRNLVARFKEMEHGGETYSPERKAVHKITPPREELAAGIEEARQQQVIREDSPEPAYHEDHVKSGGESNAEDELPPPQLTRQMLAKFKSLEDVNQPPSPQPAKALTKTPQADKTQYKQRQSSRASPDSGIVDVDHHQTPLNGHSDAKQGDDEEETKEMPEQGFTRNLLAKWRCIEETSPEPVLPVSRSNSSRQKAPSQATVKQQRTPSPAPERDHHEVTSPAGNGLDYEDGDQSREVIRESDTNEEEFMPPPSFTKNMLAKFQTMEAEAERQAATEQTLPVRKHFKWTVKEAPLINRSGMVWQEKRRDSSMDGEFDEDQSREEQDSYRDDYQEDSDQQVFYQTANRSEQHHEPVHRQSKASSASVDRSSRSYETRDSHSEDESEMHHRDPTISVSYCDPEEELPPQALTRNMLAKFRSIEDVNQPPPSPVRSQQQQKVAYSSGTGSGTRKFSSTSSLNQQDVQTTHVYSDREDELEEHYDSSRDYYENEVEGGEFENDPYHDPDLIRESDRAEEEELPEEGITRNLLAKFQSLTAAH